MSLRVIACVALAAGALAPSTGRACTPRCPAFAAAPPDGAVVPANVPALVVRSPDLRCWYSMCQGIELETPEIIDSGERSVGFEYLDPGSNAPHLLVLAAPLTSGETYRFRYPDPCATATNCREGTCVIPFREQTLVAGPIAPLPTSLGEVEVSEACVEVAPISTRRGSCVVNATVATLRLSIRPSADLVPFLPVTYFTSSVRGEETGRTPHAPELVDGQLAGDAVGPIYSRCDAWDDLDANGLSPGIHEVIVRAWIAGLAQPLEHRVAIEIRCDGVPLCDGSGTWAAPDSGQPILPDAGPPAAPPATALCVVARGQGSATGPLFGLLAVCAWCGRRYVRSRT